MDVLICMESKLCCVVGCLTTEHGRYRQSCMQKLWSAQKVLTLYDTLECMLHSEYGIFFACRKAGE